MINVTGVASLNLVVVHVSQGVSACAIKCSKQLLSRDLSSIVCSTTFCGLDSQAFSDIYLKRKTDPLVDIINNHLI